jgi:hypothetical protein
LNLIKHGFAVLSEASQGSPIFIASILQLLSPGGDFGDIVERWKGSEGEVVRRFSFEREIKSLSYSTQRTLFAMQLMAKTNFDELRDILDVVKQNLLSDLGKLRQFHLFVGPDDPGTGAPLTVPEPIRLMFEVTEDVLNKEDATDIKKSCAEEWLIAARRSRSHRVASSYPIDGCRAIR